MADVHNGSERSNRGRASFWNRQSLATVARMFRRALAKPVAPASLRRVFGLAVACLLITSSAFGQADSPIGGLLPKGIGGPADWTSPQGLASTLQVMLLLTVVSLAAAILLMTTGFVRIVVVLGLLRQALGTQQLPPSQVITSIALFMTLLLMAPVWNETYEKGIRPYTNSEISMNVAFERGVLPVRKFMAHQIQVTKNDDDVYLFLKYMPEDKSDAKGSTPNYVYYEPAQGETE